MRAPVIRPRPSLAAEDGVTPTLAEAIRVGLADEITSGHLHPGAELDEHEIAKRFGVSRTPVREALRELASAGLVSIQPRRGVRVAALTPDHLGDLFELMAETEAMCARLATYRMTANERFALQSLHRNSLAAVRADDVNAYDALNRDFHAAIYRGTHNESLVKHASQLRLRLAPYRRAQLRSDQRLKQSHAEHEAILAQMLRGDGAEAELTMRAHMLTASVALAAYIEESSRK
ncbi:MAG TPA: GntR family transcriptional regulator [Aliidongia sp.]|nr:GntR family transcriptional regulator [Aliidongia sp.]